MASTSSEKQQTGRDIESMLSGRGIFLTTQRRLIAEILFSCNQHVTAEQLHDQIRHAGHKVSKATVYNTLSLFSKQGLLRPINVEGSVTFYDSNTSHHHHLFNIDSGELVDMDENLLPDSQSLTGTLPVGTSLEAVDLVIRVRNNPS
jgi:Fur family transcriptional regulator, iron response regulator